MLYPIYFELQVGYETFSQAQFPVLIFLVVSAPVKARPSAEYIGIKISVLPPTQPVFTVIVLTILPANFTNISIVLKGLSPQHFILLKL